MRPGGRAYVERYRVLRHAYSYRKGRETRLPQGTPTEGSLNGIGPCQQCTERFRQVPRLFARLRGATP